MKDVIVVAADSYQEKVLEALLPRVPASSNTQAFTFDIVRNPRNDSGSYNDSHELLRPAIKLYRYAIVIFDYEGSGVEDVKSRIEVEKDVEALLNKNGWQGRNCVVVIKPELENWMWVDSPHVQDAIGWQELESLYIWARAKGRIAHGDHKPIRPKETLEEAMRVSKTPKSAAIYKKIASKVSYRRCEDPAFQKLINQLTVWFPQNQP
jgi:hypothetical protein